MVGGGGGCLGDVGGGGGCGQAPKRLLAVIAVKGATLQNLRVLGAAYLLQKADVCFRIQVLEPGPGRN